MADQPITITVDDSEVQDVIAAWLNATKRSVTTGEFNRALSQAINRALDMGRTHAIRETMARYTVLKKDVQKTVKKRLISQERFGTVGRVDLCRHQN
jgi:hypothetical protein